MFLNGGDIGVEYITDFLRKGERGAIKGRQARNEGRNEIFVTRRMVTLTRRTKEQETTWHVLDVVKGSFGPGDCC